MAQDGKYINSDCPVTLRDLAGCDEIQPGETICVYENGERIASGTIDDKSIQKLSGQQGQAYRYIGEDGISFETGLSRRKICDMTGWSAPKIRWRANEGVPRASAKPVERASASGRKSRTSKSAGSRSGKKQDKTILSAIKTRERRSRRVQLILPSQTIAAVRTEAADRGLSANEFYNRAIQWFLEPEMEKKDPDAGRDPVELLMQPSVYDALSSQASSQGRSVSETVNLAVTYYLKNLPPVENEPIKGQISFDSMYAKA
ncbi:MAG: hypothetical protein LUC17_03240 [Oscillospiraceae bacterium]|nr:hypothetical protein [Oscillospiraceae bacterium]